MLIEQIYKNKEKSIKISPCHVNRASEAGHPCELYLVLARTNWQDKPLHDVRLQMIFDEGNHQEKIIMRDLEDAGVQIIEQQRDYHWPAFELSAHLDGKAVIEGIATPIECKSMAPHIFDQINTLDDLMGSKKPWLRKYPAQIQLYLLLSNSDKGYLVLKNKSTGALKEIEVKLDLEYAESILKKLELVNKHVKDGTRPEPMPYDEDVCGMCPFFQTVCMVEVKRDAMELSGDAELAAALARRDELSAAKKEYEALDKDIKRKIGNMPKVICGDYLVTGKAIKREGYTVEASTYWKTTITKIGGAR